MRNNKFLRFLTSKYFILGIQLIISITVVYFIFKLNLVPTKYLIGIIAGLLILLCGFFGIIYSGEKRIL